MIIVLIQAVTEKKSHKFTHFKTLKCHDLPLTNCSFNKTGDKFITGSYDQSCIIWDTDTGNILHKLKSHKNVVYAIAFNLPYGDKVATGSFDTTAKVYYINNNNHNLFVSRSGTLNTANYLQPSADIKQKSSA